MGLGADSDSSPTGSGSDSPASSSIAGSESHGASAADSAGAPGTHFNAQPDVGPIGFGDGSDGDIGTLIKAALLQGWGAGTADQGAAGDTATAAFDAHTLDLGKIAALDHIGDVAPFGGDALMGEHMDGGDGAYDAHVPLTLTGGDLLPAVGATLDLLTSSAHLDDVPAIDSHDLSGDALPA